MNNPNYNEDGIHWTANRYTYKGFSVVLEMYGNKWNFATEGSWCTESFDTRIAAKMAAEESIDYDLEHEVEE